MAGLSQIFNPNEATLILNGNLFSKFASGENIVITFPNSLHTVTRGQDSSAIFKKRTDGKQGTIDIPLLSASIDDRFLNNAARNSEMLSGSYRCPFKDSDGNITLENFILDGGIVEKFPDITKSDADGKDMLTYRVLFTVIDRLV